jgi:hypothetical protein
VGTRHSVPRVVPNASHRLSKPRGDILHWRPNEDAASEVPVIVADSALVSSGHFVLGGLNPICQFGALPAPPGQHRQLLKEPCAHYPLTHIPSALAPASDTTEHGRSNRLGREDFRLKDCPIAGLRSASARDHNGL